MAISEETRERIIKFFGFAKKAFHVAFIPVILRTGFSTSTPRPSFLRLISPLAA
ncbi:putative mitochondrial import receptor subunit tom7 [Chytriomyces sp. MP71]|nr:putative mitochondrial import receptor subunit tom7 [Chytriomyces sp. MP71]